MTIFLKNEIFYDFLLLFFSKQFEGEVRLPDVVIFLHTKDGTQYQDHKAIKDSAKMSIASIGIVDTDCDPNIISYPIPGNDDSLVSQQLYLQLFKKAIMLGKKKRQEHGLMLNDKQFEL